MSFASPATIAPPVYLKEVERLFSKTKGQLFFRKRAGLLGGLLAKLKVVWTETFPDGSPCSTAAISATTLYWNPVFFMSLDPDTRVTVLAHELWHNLALHGLRVGTRNRGAWNEAGDHMINLQLKSDGYYMDGFPYLMDDKYASWATEDIYDDIMQECGGNYPQPQNVDGSPSLSGDVMPFDKADAHKAITNVIGAMASARFSDKNAGALPGEVTHTIDQFLNPKLPWWQLFENFFNELCQYSRSYQRPHRRYNDPIMPGSMGMEGLEHLFYAVDVSGSIRDEEIVAMNSEVKYIWDELKPKKLTLQLFDTQIRSTFIYEEGDTFDSIEITGRGGTNLDNVFEVVQAEQPSALVVFSDMWVNIPDDPGIPVIWVCTNNPNFNEVPYGRLVRLDTDEQRP